MSSSKVLGGHNSSTKPVGPNVKVTDILVRGGGGTITFSDGVTVEYMFGFRPDSTIPSGGVFDVTLVGNRAQLVYQNIVSQSVCDMIDWLMQCSSLYHRVAVLEAALGVAKEFPFTVADWNSSNNLTIIRTGTPIAGQIGPHELPIGRAYHISIFRDTGAPVITGIDIEVQVNLTTGNVTLHKVGLVQPFDGRLIIS